MLTRLAVCAAVGAARLVELSWSRRNLAAAGETLEGAWSRRTYPLVIALHTLVIAGTAVSGQRRARLPWLALLLGVQPVRLWVLATLGRRWNTRGAVAAETAVETGGPYRFVRHPNYAVVAVELLALPLAFGLGRLAAMAAVANGLLLAIRIRDEEAALRELDGYDEHFAAKARFIPGVF